jgi:hypothetical protein
MTSRAAARDPPCASKHSETDRFKYSTSTILFRLQYSSARAETDRNGIRLALPTAAQNAVAAVALLIVRTA